MARLRWLKVWCGANGRPVATIVGAALFLSSLASGAGAQSVPAGGGATPGATYKLPEKPALISSSGNTEILRHRDFSGKPCLNIAGFARAYSANAKLYDHVIGAENRCPKPIKLSVCYFGSISCTPMEVPGNARKEVVLGTMPSQKDFRFEFRERF